MRREHFDLEAGAQSAFLSTHQSCAFIVEETRNGVINLSTLFFFFFYLTHLRFMEFGTPKPL